MFEILLKTSVCIRHLQMIPDQEVPSLGNPAPVQPCLFSRGKHLRRRRGGGISQWTELFVFLSRSLQGGLLPKRRSSVQAGAGGRARRRDLVSKRRDGRWVYATIIPAAAVPRSRSYKSPPFRPRSQMARLRCARSPLLWGSMDGRIALLPYARRRRSFWIEVAWQPNSTGMTRAAVGDCRKQKMRWTRETEARATT